MAKHNTKIIWEKPNTLICISTIQLFFELPVYKEKRLSSEGHELELQVIGPHAINITRALQFLVLWLSVIPLQRFLSCVWKTIAGITTKALRAVKYTVYIFYI